MRKLTLEQVLQLHVLVLQQTGGGEGLRDLGRLESVIATQTQEVFDEELYVGVYQKAAAIARGIVSDHPFIDGNKRTAILVATTFLSINGYFLTAEAGELEDFAVKIATEELDVPDIAIWLQDRTKKK